MKDHTTGLSHKASPKICRSVILIKTLQTSKSRNMITITFGQTLPQMFGSRLCDKMTAGVRHGTSTATVNILGIF